MPGQKVLQQMTHTCQVVGAASLGEQVLHRHLLLRQRFVLPLRQCDRDHHINRRAHQPQAQHGLQCKPERQPPAQAGGRCSLAHGSRASST